MTLQQLEYFLAAADHRSFSAAAQALHMAQPSLSDQIRRLEAELGSPLFVRARRGLELTEAGRLLLPQAERTLAAAQEAADAVRDGHIEAGLIVLPIDDRGLDVDPAIHDELLYLSADPERVREPMTIERLAEAPLILYDARFGWNDPTRRQLADRAQRAGVTLEPEIEVEYVEAALDLAARGLGDTIGTRRIALGRAFARRLHSARFEPPVIDTFAFVTRRNAHLSPATRAFMTLAAKRMEALGRRGGGAD